MIRRILFTIRAFIRSHDRSTPERPRKDGSYGWPHKSSREMTPKCGSDQ